MIQIHEVSLIKMMMLIEKLLQAILIFVSKSMSNRITDGYV